MSVQSKLTHLLYIYNRNKTINWKKTVPKWEDESDIDWKKRVKILKSRHDHEIRCNTEEKKLKLYKKQKQWKIDNKEQINEYHKSRYDKERYKILWEAARTRAAKSNIEFSLSKENIKKVINVGLCQATNLPFEISSNRRGPYSPSIDRIDNSKGYSDNNCLVVCWCFNAGKNHFNIEDYIKICKKVVENSKNLNQIYGIK